MFGQTSCGTVAGPCHWVPNMLPAVERHLTDSDAELWRLGDQAPAMIWRAEADKNCTWFSRSWLEFRGRTAAQEIGRGWTEGVHPDDLKRCDQVYGQAFEARAEFSISYRLRRRDGAYRWILETARPYISPGRTFLGFIGSCADITPQKEAERRLHDALAEQENLLDEIRHRVRNNMQIVLGFVRLLYRHVQEPGGELGQVSARIQALAHMQQYFYARPERVSHIELLNFLHAFTADFVREAGLPIRVEVTGKEVAVDIGKATSIGLAVTEAILACAARAHETGELRIRLTHDGDDLLISIDNYGRAPHETEMDASPNGLLEQYARLVAGAVEVTKSKRRTRILLRLAA